MQESIHSSLQFTNIYYAINNTHLYDQITEVSYFRILPLVKKHHLLLVTLLLGNAAAMETLPLFLDKMVPTWVISFSILFPFIFCILRHNNCSQRSFRLPLYYL
jgi:hypothetical protein